MHLCIYLWSAPSHVLPSSSCQVEGCVSDAGTAVQVPMADSTSCRHPLAMLVHGTQPHPSATHSCLGLLKQTDVGCLHYMDATTQHGTPLATCTNTDTQAQHPANTWCDKDNEAMTLKSPDRQTGTCTVTRQPNNLPGLHSSLCMSAIAWSNWPYFTLGGVSWFPPSVHT
jgi:hypothetical protein